MTHGTADLELIPCVVATDCEITAELSPGEDYPAIAAGSTVGPDGQPWVIVAIHSANGGQRLALLNESACLAFLESMTTAIAAIRASGDRYASAH